MTTKEIILLNLNKKIEELKKINEKMMNALIPCWTEIEQNRGYIMGLQSAILMIKKESQMGEIRDCANCVNHTANGCTVWECKFEEKGEKA